MIPGEIITVGGEIELNKGLPTVTLKVANTGDRPIQVGSHYHFFETNPALSFDAGRGARHAARHRRRHRRAVRAGAERKVRLVAFGGDRIVHGFRGETEGKV
jgi:urease subunit beta